MKSDLLKAYLRAPRELILAAIATNPNDDVDTVDFEVDVDLPQRPLFPILPVEQIRVVFPTDGERPLIFLSRADFPAVPHLIQDLNEFPRQMCLYEGPWNDEKSNWAPGPFVERIRKWLSGTADGTLHRADQPLEPLLFSSPYKLVLPRIPVSEDKLCWSNSYFLECRGNPKEDLYFVCSDEKIEGSKPNKVPVLFVKGPPTVHGLINRFPKNLSDLESMLQNLGGSLVDAICAELNTLLEDLKRPELCSERLIIVLQLPKQRMDNGPIESWEHQAFLLNVNIGDLLKIDTEYHQEGALFIPKNQEAIRDSSKLAGINLTPTSVRWHLDRNSAAAFNGVSRTDIKILAIGVGSLGSQVVSHLHKGAFGSWTLMDDDIFEPHNSARHLLSSYAVGFKKVDITGAYLSQIFGPNEPIVTIACDYLSPHSEPQAQGALEQADLILDFSASIAVERALANDKRSKARRVSVFLNQRGDELVVLAENRSREIKLDWLEAEYMRAVAFDERLNGHFDDVKVVAHRYGNSCRDLSAVIRQDFVAIHSGLAANRIRQCIAVDEASICVYRLNKTTGAVVPVEIGIHQSQTSVIDGWQVCIHPEVFNKIIQMREEKLPDETGGVMLGLVDRSRRFISILDSLSAPPDSQEWPTSFIRGSIGLKKEVERVTEKTLGNVIYIGEWHSHPPRHNAKPSQTDWEAIAICSVHMDADGLPTTMLIAGHKGEVRIAFKPLGKLKGYETQVNAKS